MVRASILLPLLVACSMSPDSSPYDEVLPINIASDDPARVKFNDAAFDKLPAAESKLLGDYLGRAFLSDPEAELGITAREAIDRQRLYEIEAPKREARIIEALERLTAEDVAAKAEALKAFPAVEVDEIGGRKRWEPKAAPKYVNSRTAVYAKVATDLKDVVSAVLVEFIYVGDDWLFFDSVTIAVGDFRSKLTFNEPKHDNGSGEVWEWALLVMTPAPALPGLAIATTVAEKMADPSAKVTIRFEGRQYYKDYELKPGEKASIAAGVILAKPAPTREDAIAAIAASSTVTTPKADAPTPETTPSKPK